ncbi:hypothetical protein [Corynebacterium liangguodongii]|uniref:Uncharacterized protein n=1 Tax=Corynebacterium liangguodongii TaxID=2079535 RepID=A0A2S0WG86_9CORY|nr:hypothetical protein [Corynebacterium liangguodongii]AWB84783.1 hypothetical protein C3E79_10115 [Corynebacterium liangguodongii]PWB99141.1 hypothetical protein DF219_07730 [Corynebacterium liangguodongii]
MRKALVATAATLAITLTACGMSDEERQAKEADRYMSVFTKLWDMDITLDKDAALQICDMKHDGLDTNEMVEKVHPVDEDGYRQAATIIQREMCLG